MKRNTPDHPKMMELADRISALLDLPFATSHTIAVGTLERLWHWVAKYMPRGNVGTRSDAQIANAVGWPGKPSELVETLLETRWFDAHPEHRLIIHDWAEHCEDQAHYQVAKSRTYFADGSAPRTRALRARDRKEAEEFYAANPSPPQAPREEPPVSTGRPPDPPRENRPEHTTRDAPRENGPVSRVALASASASASATARGCGGDDIDARTPETASDPPPRGGLPPPEPPPAAAARDLAPPGDPSAPDAPPPPDDPRPDGTPSAAASTLQRPDPPPPPDTPPADPAASDAGAPHPTHPTDPAHPAGLLALLNDVLQPRSVSAVMRDVGTEPEDLRRLAWLAERARDDALGNPAGWIRTGLRERWDVPEDYRTPLQRAEDDRRRDAEIAAKHEAVGRREQRERERAETERAKRDMERAAERAEQLAVIERTWPEVLERAVAAVIESEPEAAREALGGADLRGDAMPDRVLRRKVAEWLTARPETRGSPRLASEPAPLPASPEPPPRDPLADVPDDELRRGIAQIADEAGGGFLATVMRRLAPADVRAAAGGTAAMVRTRLVARYAEVT